MYVMYVDESGDCGLPSQGSPTRYFCLTGLVVHEMRWTDTMKELLRFRHWIKSRYKVYLDDELHAAEMISKRSKVAASLQSLPKHDRLAIIRHIADRLGSLPDISLVNVCVDKLLGKDKDSTSVFRRGWYALFQRFENTIRYQNFPGPKNSDDRGMIFVDNTDGARLKAYLDDMRMRNLLSIKQRDGGRVRIDEPIKVIVEDPVCRDSRHSYLIQAADCAAFLFKQSLQPSSYMKKHGGSAYFRTRLAPVLCKHASNSDPLGVVRI